MKKLEDISKENIYKIPEGYFDKLPGIIQSRTALKNQAETSLAFLMPALRYSIPVLVLVTAAFIFFYGAEKWVNGS